MYEKLNYTVWTPPYRKNSFQRHKLEEKSQVIMLLICVSFSIVLTTSNEIIYMIHDLIINILHILVKIAPLPPINWISHTARNHVIDSLPQHR